MTDAVPMLLSVLLSAVLFELVDPDRRSERVFDELFRLRDRDVADEADDAEADVELRLVLDPDDPDRLRPDRVEPLPLRELDRLLPVFDRLLLDPPRFDRLDREVLDDPDRVLDVDRVELVDCVELPEPPPRLVPRFQMSAEGKLTLRLAT
ncbi:hypothetical protein [Haloarchaeobius sp. DT45]|uniref:hypothetical protein n=1 Tax=Haloarchaeobius sp. DT45 TaxID=3446116 RepID=UPI003F6C13B5